MVAAETGSIVVWSPSKATQVRVDAGVHLTGLANSDDGRYVAAIGAHDVRVVATDGEVTARVSVGTAQLNRVAFLHGVRSHDLAVATDDKHVRVFDGLNGALRHDFVHDAGTNAASSSFDGALLVVAVEDGHSVLWDLSSDERLGIFDRHNAETIDATFAPSGDFVVTSGAEGAVKVWDAKTRREIASFGTNEVNMMTVAVSGDGARVLSRDQAGHAYLWNLQRDGRLSDELDRLRQCLVPLALGALGVVPGPSDPNRCGR